MPTLTVDEHYRVATQPALSAGMRRLNGLHAQRFNRRYDRVGHLFQGRFDSRVIESDEYLYDACEYVAQNPVAAGICDAPEDWPWSYRRDGEGDGA